MIKLPTKYATVYDSNINEILKINIDRINNNKYNLKYITIKYVY